MFEQLTQAKSPTFTPKQKQDFAFGDAKCIEFVKEQVRFYQTTARICLHPSVDSDLHSMIIGHPKGIYIRPHKNPHHSKLYHLIEGQMRIIGLGDDEKKLFDIMLSFQNEQICRIEKNIYLLLIPQSEIVIFHEIALGPLRGGGQIYAPFSPEVGKGGIDEFIARYAQGAH